MRSSIETAIPAVGRGEPTIVTDDERRENEDEGHDTVDANLRLGLPLDAREYAIAAQILLAPRRTEHNVTYLAAKRARMGHLFDGAEATVR